MGHFFKQLLSFLFQIRRWLLTEVCERSALSQGDVLVCVCVCAQNPQYSSTSTYVIYAHLLRQIAALSEADHHFLVHWLKK